MPFTYLGLPLDLTKPHVSEFMPVLTRVEKHLMGIFRMLTYVGRFVLVNSVYTSLPTFFMCSLKIPLVWISLRSTTNIVCGMGVIWQKKEVVWWHGSMPGEVKKRVDLESSTLGHKTQLSCSNFSTSSTIKLIFLGFTSYGSICMLMAIPHMLEKMWVSSGGVM